MAATRRKLSAVPLLTGLLLLIIAAMLAPYPRSASAADAKVTLRGAGGVGLDTLNPFATFNAFVPTIFTYDFLVGVDASLNSDRRGFAESWSTAADGLTWTFKIHPGMTWSDGQPATARDVAFTFNYLKDSIGTPNELNAGWNNTELIGRNLDSIKAIDDTTVEVRTKTPTTWPAESTILIVAEHVWKDIPYQQARTGTAGNTPPLVGTGPFVVAEWKPDQFIRLTRHPKWRSTLGVEEVVLVTIQTPDGVVQALQNGEIDVTSGLTPGQFKEVTKNPLIKGAKLPTDQTDYLAFNAWPEGKSAASTSAVRDPAFRNALRYAVDTKAVVDRGMQGNGVAGVSLIPTTATAFKDHSGATPTWSIDEAKARLDAAGYRDSNGDGTREDKEGKPIRLGLIYGPVAGNIDIPTPIIELLVDWFGQAGVPVDATLLDVGALQQRVEAQPGDWDLYVGPRWFSPFPDDYLRIAHGGADLAVQSQNPTGWDNPQYNELYGKATQTVDPAKRLELIDQMVALVAAESPYIFLDYPVSLQAYRTDKFQGWDPDEPISNWSFYPWDRLTPLAGPGSASSDNRPLLIGALVVLLTAVTLVFVGIRRRRSPNTPTSA